MDIVKPLLSILLMIPATYFAVKLLVRDESIRVILVILLVIFAFMLGVSYWFEAPIWGF